MSRRTALSPQTVAVLRLLAQAPDRWWHGYDVARRTGLKSGTLYPILMRLHERGLLDAEWEENPPSGRPRRHTYRLTAQGATVAESLPEPNRGVRLDGQAVRPVDPGEAILSEAAHVEPGWPRTLWLAGGVVAALKEGVMSVRWGAWLGVAAAASLVAFTIWKYPVAVGRST